MQAGQQGTQVAVWRADGDLLEDILQFVCLAAARHVNCRQGLRIDSDNR